MKPRASVSGHPRPKPAPRTPLPASVSGHPRSKPASRTPLQRTSARSLLLALLIAALAVESAWAEPKFPGPSSSSEAVSSLNDPVTPAPPAVAPAVAPEAPMPPPAVSMKWAGLRLAGAVLAVGLLLAGAVAGYRRLVDHAGRSRSTRGRARARQGWWSFWAPDTPAEADRIHLASRRSLGPRESLGVVQVGRERFLVGITGASISLLARLGESGRTSEAEPAAADFALELDEATQPRRALLRPPTVQGDLADLATVNPATTNPVTVDAAIRARLARSRDRLARIGRLTAVAQEPRD